MRVVGIVLGLLVILGGFNALRLRQIDRGIEAFESSCRSACGEAGDLALCESYCACFLDELLVRHPSKTELSAHLNRMDRRIRENGTRFEDEPEILDIAKTCVDKIGH